MDFFIVWGRKVRTRLVGYTCWRCPACGRVAPATVRDKESSFHLYFIPFGYSYAGRFAECHWCETELHVEPEQFSTVDEDRWRPGEPADALAAALGLKIEGRAFEAAPTGTQLLRLWSNLRWRIKKVVGENLGRFSLSSGLMAAAVAVPLFAILCVIVGPEGKTGENVLVGMGGGAMLGFPLGLIFGAATRALLGHRGYADRKLRDVLGDNVPLEPLKKLLEQARRIMEKQGRRLSENAPDEAGLQAIQGLLDRIAAELRGNGLEAPPASGLAPELPRGPVPSALPTRDDPETAPQPARLKAQPPAFRFNIQAVEPCSGPDNLHVLRGRIKTGEVRPNDRLLLTAGGGSSEAVVVRVNVTAGGPAPASLGPQASLLVRGLDAGAVRVGDVLLGAPRSEPSPPPPSPAAGPADAGLELACPHCRKKLKVQRRLTGRTVRCPACKQPFTIGEP